MKKIPDNATRVFKGVMFEVWQWPQTMFDGSTETFEAIRRVPSTEIILVDGDEIIVADQEQPRFRKFVSLFGGRIEEGEEPLASAKRELLEESGYEADSWELLEVTNFPWAKIDFDNYLYVARGARLVAKQNLDAGERIALRRVSFDEFIVLATTNLRWSPPVEFRTLEIHPAVSDWLKTRIFSSDNH